MKVQIKKYNLISAVFLAIVTILVPVPTAQTIEHAPAQHELNTQLIIAAKNNNSDELARLLADRTITHININAQDPEGDTALIWAARNSHVANVRLLLAANVNVEIKNRFGYTALIEVIRNFSADTAADANTIVTLLLAANANPNLADNYGYTALIEAARNRHATIDIVVQLIAAGADLNTKTHTDLHTALEFAVTNRHHNIIIQLLTTGAIIPESLHTNSIILGIPEALRKQSPLIRALTSGYHKQVVNIITNPEIINLIATTDLDLNINNYNFLINPGQEILPNILEPGTLVATGRIRNPDEIGPESTAEYFSLLDLAVLSCQPELVNGLLKAGVNPINLTNQTRKLLDQIDIGTIELESKESSSDPVSAEIKIARMIASADIAHSPTVQAALRDPVAERKLLEKSSRQLLTYAYANRAYRAWKIA